jgi:hypothetical protein
VPPAQGTAPSHVVPLQGFFGLPGLGCGCACLPPIHGGPWPVAFGGPPEPGLPGGFLYVREGFSGAYIGIPVRPGFGTSCF